MTDFKVGDVVVLQSGGPKMTVAWAEPVYEELKIHCEWFDDEGLLKNHTFYADSLRHVPDT